MQHCFWLTDTTCLTRTHALVAENPIPCLSYVDNARVPKMVPMCRPSVHSGWINGAFLKREGKGRRTHTVASAGLEQADDSEVMTCLGVC